MAWQKKFHVTSSMAMDNNGYAMFLGRFQPLHEGHKKLFQQVLDEGKKICIMVRDMPVDEKNPFSAEQVCKTIQDYLQAERKAQNVLVMLVPNITSINFGRGVGYDIVEYIPPDGIKAISATKIREEMKEKGSFQDFTTKGKDNITGQTKLDDGSKTINSDLPLLP